MAELKIALFSASLAGGGAQRVILTLAQAFKERGHPVQLLLAQARGEFLGDVPAGIPVHDLGQAHVFQALPGLIRVLRRERPDILLSTQTHANLVALWAARLAGVQTKVVVREANTMSVNAALTSRKELLLTRLARIFYPQAGGIVAISNGAAADLRRTAHLRPEKIKVIYNPVVSPALLEKALQPPAHPWFASGCPPVVLAVGRLVENKDFPTLLRAFARARQRQELHLLILGEGNQRRDLEALVKTLGLERQVQLPGFTPNPFAYMAHAAVFVLCSRVEGFGNVLAEALACGTPVVSTDCPSGPAEILEGGRYGALVPVGDDEKLAEAILKALQSPPDKSLLQARGAEFSVDRAVEQYLALFHSLERK